MQTEDNVLEIGLELAAAEPAHRPEFFRLLLESTIFILGSSEQMDEGSVTLKANTQVQIKNRVKPDGSSVIPFFSSLRALQLAIKSDEPYIALPARTFFQITRGAELILNPRSEYGKEFTLAEVEALLSEGVSQLAEQRVVEKDVKAAYLALMHDVSRDEKPHLIVGIEAESDFENVIREAGTVAADTAPNGEPVDLIRVVRGESGVGQYFLEEVKPFYERE